MSMFNRLAHLFGLPVRAEPTPERVKATRSFWESNPDAFHAVYPELSPRASSSAACVERLGPSASDPDVDGPSLPTITIAELCERIDILEGDNQLLQQKLQFRKRALDEWTRDYNLMYTAYLNRCDEFVQQREHLAAAADGLRLAAEIDPEAPQYWLDLADDIDPQATQMTAYYADEQVTRPRRRRWRSGSTSRSHNTMNEWNLRRIRELHSEAIDDDDESEYYKCNVCIECGQLYPCNTIRAISPIKQPSPMTADQPDRQAVTWEPEPLEVEGEPA